MTEPETAGQLAPEVGHWLEQRQGTLHITTSTTAPDGRTLDWVPIESQASGHIATPPPAVPPHVPADPARPTRAAQFATSQPGPAAHVPVLRPDLTRVRNLADLSRAQAKRGGLLFSTRQGITHPPGPIPRGYFHATSSMDDLAVYGTEAWLNVWDPKIDLPSSPGEDHSISQLWLLNDDSRRQSAEAGLTVDRGINGNVANHLFTYFTTNGYQDDGDNIGGYNRSHKGWVQYHPLIYPGIALKGASTQAGSPQLEVGLKYQLWQGNWWLGVSSDESKPWTWIGYYPGSLYGGGLATMARWVGWGGEVYSALGNPCATKDQMGSGRHAAKGWTHACYQRLIRYQTDAHAALADFAGTSEMDAPAGCASNPYTISSFMHSGSAWGSYQYFGGPAA